MTKVKKVLGVIMVMVMLVSLAACGGTKEVTDEKEAVVNEESATTESTDTEVDTSTDMTEELEPVTLTWYYIGDQQPNEAKVFEAANKIIQEKINATVEFKRFSFGEYPQQMPLLLSAGENIDLLFTADWSLSYSDLVSKGALLELDGLIDSNMPGTKELMPASIFDATRIGGKIYGVPNYQISYRQPALIFKKEIVDKYDLKDAIFAVKKLSDLTPIFEKVKANEPEMFMSQVSPGFKKWDIIAKEDYYEDFVGLPGGVNYDLEIVEALTDPKYAALYTGDFELAKLWNEKGYFHPDASLSPDLTAEMQAGKFFVLEDVYKPGIEADMQSRYGYEVYAVPMGLPILSTGSITATLTSINSASKNPERAAMLIELMNTDVELYNLIVFGIEGEQYTKVADNRIELIPDSGYSGYAWMMGTQFNAYLLPGQSDDVWELTKKLNEEAIPAPTLGFAFIRENVTTEIANIQTAMEELSFMTKFGLGEKEDYDKLLAETIEKVNDAGIKAYYEELRTQLDAWKSSK